MDLEGTKASEDDEVRNMNVWKELIKKYGTTDGCPGCAASET